MQRNAHRNFSVRVGGMLGIACLLAAGACGSSSSKHDAAAVLVEGCDAAMASSPDAATAMNDPVVASAAQAIQNGRQTFRYDTFGDEAFWGDTLKLHRAIAGQKLGGVGPGVSPRNALEAGLKVDAEALPADLVQKIKAGQVNLDDPATTVALLKLKAVVGVTAFLDSDGNVRSMGFQCALCHSTVDDSFSPGI